jgi:glycosyltransferase involved in cell wall biosynthesis
MGDMTIHTNSLATCQPEEASPGSMPGPGPLRIGVNLFSLVLQGGGMRQYVLQLLPWMLRLSSHQLLLFYHWRSQPSLASLLRRLTPGERSRVQLLLIEDQNDIYRHAGAFDVLFCPLCAVAPDLLDRPTLATIPDIQEQFFPEYFTDDQRHMRAYYYPYTAHAVTTLLTLSEFSKKTICDAFHLTPNRVRAIHLAPNDEIVNVRPEWPAHLGPLPQPYVFYPANLYPHKNHKTLLAALRILHHERGIDCACLLTGQPTQPGVDIHKEIAAHGLADKVRWLGQVTPAALRYLYEHALALCFPSEFEGFGMPLVEAMQCGCPVLATAVASIPEVAGDAAWLVEGTPESFADAIARLLADPQAREDLRARGRRRGQDFHARHLARQTLEAIDEATLRFWRERSTVPSAPALTYVVCPRTGGRPLAETLARLAFEVEDQDEVLILGSRQSVSDDVRTICDNLGVVRFVAADAWIDEVRRDYLLYLREGDWICQGATRAALLVLTAQPECPAVVGEVLLRGNDDKLLGRAYLPPLSQKLGRAHTSPAAVDWRRAKGLEQVCEPPCSAIFWRSSYVRDQHHCLAGPAWIADLLARVEQPVHLCYRTFASMSADLPPSVAEPARAIPQQVSAWRRVARVTRRFLVSPLVRLHRPGRVMTQRLPPWLRGPLRGLYRQVAGAGEIKGEDSGP